MFGESWATAVDFARRGPLVVPAARWRFTTSGYTMEIRSGAVPGPEDLIAGGVVTEFARLGLRASQWSGIVRSVPDPQDVRLVASLTVGVPEAPTPHEAA